jgi:uncharacterized protein YaaN involved in tellurite resistance
VTEPSDTPAVGDSGSTPRLEAPGEALVLAPPRAVSPISGEQASGMLPLDADTTSKLDGVAESYLSSVTALDPRSPDFRTKSDAVRQMGDKEIRDSAEVSNRLLDRPVRAMGSGLFDSNAPVAKSLVDLRQTIEDLDPSRQGLFSRKKIFGIIPFGDHLRDYFDKYKSAQSHIEAILQALYRGQDELRQDNAAVEQEKVNLWETMQRLNQYAYLARTLDAALEARIAQVQSSDAARAKTMREDLLFPVRQKHQDLLTQLAVSAQGYLALDLIRRNNVELIKGVDRATTTTVSALRTAVIVAQALLNQRLVLDQITALNTTTGNLIEQTSVMLKEQSAEVAQQAASSTIEVQKLRAAFSNIYATIDAIDVFKGQALVSMKQTVDALEQELGKAKSYLERTRREEGQEPASDDLVVPADLTD